jgi:hypothetical protein
MMRLAVLLVIVAACDACHSGFQGLPTRSDPAVTRLTVDGQFICTAWRGAANLVVTAGHCCEDGMNAALQGDHAVPGADLSALVDDDTNDVCVMHGEMVGAPLPLALRDPEVGDPVWSAGYPGNKFVISGGYWSGRDAYDAGVASLDAGHGGSGSPVLDEHGRVVGMFVRLMRDNSGVMLITPVEHVRKALMAARKLDER